MSNSSAENGSNFLPKDEESPIFKEWKAWFLSDAGWKTYCFTPIRGGGPTKELSFRLDHSTKFQNELNKLCDKYGLNVENPYDEEFSFGEHKTIKNSDKILYPVLERLVEVFDENQRCIKFLENEIHRLSQENIKQVKGADPTPDFIAENFLVGFLLFEGDKENLNKLRDFIKPDGGFEKWLKDNNHRKSNIISETSTNIKSWAKEKKQTFLRGLISSMVGKSIKKISDFPKEHVEIDQKIKARADIILKTAE